MTAPEPKKKSPLFYKRFVSIKIFVDERNGRTLWWIKQRLCSQIALVFEGDSEGTLPIVFTWQPWAKSLIVP